MHREMNIDLEKLKSTLKEVFTELVENKIDRIAVANILVEDVDGISVTDVFRYGDKSVSYAFAL